MRIVHIISGLNIGGAERSLVNLLQKYPLSDIGSVKIISLTRGGVLRREIMKMGFDVSEVGLSKNPISFLRLLIIFQLMLKFKPHIVQTWMYHSDLIGGIIGRILRVRIIIWNVRGSGVSFKLNGLLTYVVIRLCSFFSKYIPDAVITNSEAAIVSHSDVGYACKKFRLIYNGFDSNRFQKLDEKSITAYKKQYGVDKKTTIIGMVGRYDIYKNPFCFIRMLKSLREDYKRGDLIGIMAGEGFDEKNLEFMTFIEKMECRDYVQLIGQRSDPREVYNMFDVLVMPSTSEGFPNVVGEAMSCAVPVVATNVGDTKKLVDGIGIMVEKANPNHLAANVDLILRLSDEKLSLLKSLSRKRIKEDFSIKKMVNEYNSLYQELLR